jgi:hypothetical protein
MYDVFNAEYIVTGYWLFSGMLLLFLILFLVNKRSKRIKYLEKVQLKVIDDNIAFVRKLKELGLSDADIQSLRDKFEPEKDDKRVWQSNGAGEVFKTRKAKTKTKV